MAERVQPRDHRLRVVGTKPGDTAGLRTALGTGTGSLCSSETTRIILAWDNSPKSQPCPGAVSECSWSSGSFGIVTIPSPAGLGTALGTGTAQEGPQGPLYSSGTTGIIPAQDNPQNPSLCPGAGPERSWSSGSFGITIPRAHPPFPEFPTQPFPPVPRAVPIPSPGAVPHPQKPFPGTETIP